LFQRPRRRFIWPSPADGAVTITPAQLGYLAHAAADLAAVDGRLSGMCGSVIIQDSPARPCCDSIVPR
jgi:hypothetical protein